MTLTVSPYFIPAKIYLHNQVVILHVVKYCRRKRCLFFMICSHTIVLCEPWYFSHSCHVNIIDIRKLEDPKVTSSGVKFVPSFMNISD
jgi:hypothetical protein